MKKDELENLLCRDDFLQVMEDEKEREKILAIDPAIREMEGFEQMNPHHIYDVLWHSFHVIDEIKEDDLSNGAFRLLRVAALFHDIGKPSCMSEEILDNGTVRRHFHGHPLASAHISKPILEQLGYEGIELNHILFDICAHDIFMDFKTADDPLLKYPKLSITEKNILRRMKKFVNKFPEYHVKTSDFIRLTHLMKADAKAQAVVVINEYGIQIDSMEEKLHRMNEIQNILKKMPDVSICV